MAIKNLLVANRGEIACRIMRTARELGIRTIAVYSDADAGAPHVRAADAAIRIGPAPVSESYLSAAAIFKAAGQAGADAVHPGYGFLSENAAFAQAVIAADLTWVGPPPDAIRLMGDKAQAKQAMIAAGVSCVPGYEGNDQSDETLIRAAAEVGFPVMVKAAAGGGGRGMRLVDNVDDLPAALALARSEAEGAFGNGALIIEKAILNARHVEFQIFADAHGTFVHMGERDCSVQRRHQKILEEAPCPAMTPSLREKMGTAAIEAARTVDYRGAGTVEFLLNDSGDFYFLEMNTRLQVEHPVTEMITGFDLVALQLSVAEGSPLGFTQDDVTLTGHAIEARIYAEDPGDGFMPSTEPIALWSPPSGVRVDAGIKTGGQVSPHYDAMVAKLIAFGDTRESCLRKLSAALADTVLFGPKTNIAFLADAIRREAFENGQATTAFIDQEYGEAGISRALNGAVTPQDFAAAAVIGHLCGRARAQVSALDVPAELLDWSSSSARPTIAVFDADGAEFQVKVTAAAPGQYTAAIGTNALDVEVDLFSGTSATLRIDGTPIAYRFFDQGIGELFLSRGAITHHLIDRTRQRSTAREMAGGGAVTAPMHGRLISIDVDQGDAVAKGQRLAVLEAMKMQHEIVAQIDGQIVSVTATAGSQVAADDLILEIEPTGT